MTVGSNCALSRARAGVPGTAVVRQPFDGDRQAVDPAEPMLDGGHHQVPHVVAGDAARGGEEAHGFPVTAIEREGNPHPLAIVAADLEAIGARRSLSIAQAAKTTISLAGTEIIDDTMKPGGMPGLKD